MAGSRISYNIHAQMVTDTPRLKNHLQKIQPAAVLVLDGLGLAQELKAMLPNAIIVHRNYGVTKGDDDVHHRVSPQQWMDLRAKESDGGIFLYTTNEPGFDQQCVDWHIQLMQLAIQRGVKLVIGNWAVGTPGAEDWSKAQQMLQLLDQHRDLFIMGLHEYACGVITSGFYGGYPDNAGVQPGTPGGQNLIPKDKWPTDVSKITMFHCGRFHFLINYCQKNNIKPPRIVLTEHGMDDVSDIKPWADKLTRPSQYLNIRGWKTLQSQWNLWYNPVGWSAQRAYFEQLAWADRTIYQNSPVEAQMIFSWAHSSPDWDQFDVSEASEFQSLLEAYAQQPTAQTTAAAATPVVTKPIGMASAQVMSTPAAAAQAVQPSVAAVAPVTNGNGNGNGAAVAAQAVTVAPTATATTTASSGLQINLSPEDAKVIATGFQALGKALSDPSIAAAFQRLADVLSKSSQ